MSGRFARLAACCLILHASLPALAWAQATPQPAAAPAEAAQGFNPEQLDALLAPIALYPDPLLTQILMASTFPLQVVEAERWAEDPAHKGLSGDALTKALDPQPWDPSVKSLVPFPEVLAMMNAHLDWMQQLGYAFAEQQADVLNSVQRLRRQAQANGNLQSTPQQVVRTEQEMLVIDPAQPDVVYVPSYNPTVVYGAWPYPAYPPVYLPPPPGYALGTALATGLAFGVGVAITAGLWNWARPAWGGGYVNVNVNRYNNINVNRAAIHSNVWQANRPGGRPAGLTRPPGGPVGNPARLNGLSAGAIGRQQVSVPGSAVRPPTRPAGPVGGGGTRPGAPGNVAQGGLANRPGGAPTLGNRPNQLPAGNRPGGPTNAPGGGQLANRPNSGNRPGAATGAPGGGQLANRPSQLPAATRPGGSGAFGGVSEGRQAGQFGQRGAQSRSFGQMQRPAGGGGGARAGGGGGGHAGGRVAGRR